MAKWQPMDIVVRSKVEQWSHPIVILGEYTFPNGRKGYRIRSAIPQLDMLDDTEYWDKDGFMYEEYLDEFKLLWRKGEENDI